MMNDIYEALLVDSYIKNEVGNRIKFYEYPEAKDIKETHIIIDPLDVPKPSDYADDVWLTDDYIFQIDVWSKHFDVTHKIANKVRIIMWELGFKQNDGIDEWEKDYDIFRDARRYRGKAYRKDFDSI